MTRTSLRRLIPAALVVIVVGPIAAGQSPAWIRQSGTAEHEVAVFSAPDGAGGLILGGHTSPLVSADEDVWIARHDAAGTQLWLRKLVTPDDEYASAGAPDGAGGLYVAGSTIHITGGGLAWIARYDAQGILLWLWQLNTPHIEAAYAVAPDGSGGAFVAGASHGSLGGPNAGGADAWLARYDGAGDQLWIRQLGTSGHEHAFAIAQDGSGGVYLCGETQGALGAPKAGGLIDYDAWLARYDGAGSQLWVRQLGTTEREVAYAATADGSGGVYVGGDTEGSLGGPKAGPPLDDDVWLARFDSTGNQVWIDQLGTDATDFARSAAPDGAGGVYLCGSTQGTLGGPTAGFYDAWLARYDSSGNRLWTAQIGSAAADYGSAIAWDPAGGLFLSGTTYGNLGGPGAGPPEYWIARYFDSCTVLAYCTAKTTSSGCVPSIGSSGTPSIAAGTFAVTGASIEGGQLGVVFHGSDGSAWSPFQGGVLCVAPPVLRLGVQHSGGTLGACDGSYAQPAAASVLASAGAGSTVWFQIWFRDPGAASGTGLSDALAVLVCP
jgi:catechol 2,3-dioxygenase-like lactoylglutathione lyase family enzyme